MLNGFFRACAAAVIVLMGFTGLPALAGDSTAAAPENTAASESIVQIALADPALSTLVKALTDTNLVKTLEGAGPFTVFAPTNEAFGKLPTALLDYLLANPAILKQVLLYHVASGADMLTESPIKTVQGESVFPSFSYGTWGLTVRVNSSVLKAKPIKASNGVIYIVDSVLIPQFR